MLKAEKIVVLNVDDYEAGRYATTRVLQQAGFEVVEATSGEEALRLVRARPDLVVLDVNLPDIDGFEVCRRIKESPETTDIPVLYLSAAYRTAEHRIQGLDLGADGYLTQPVDPRELVAMVNALVRAQHVRHAVRRNEQRFGALLIATSDIVWTTDAEGRIVGEMPDWAEFTGQSADEYRGWGWLQAVHPDDRSVVAELWARALEERTVYEAEYRLRRTDGVYRYTLSRAVPVLEENGSVREWVGANSDVTERRQAEMELRERNRRLEFLSDAASRLLLVADPREYVEHLFNQLSAYLDLEVYFNYLLARDGRGLALNAYRGVPPETAAQVADLGTGEAVSRHVAATRMEEVLEEVQASRNPRAELLRSLGINAYACYPLLSDRQLIGTLSFGTRTRSRFTPDELSLLQTVCSQVAVAVDRARLIAALQERARALEEANRAKSDFLATMSHELRTPLNAMVGYTDLLLMGVPEPITPGATVQVERIRAAALHLTQLIEEVLMHARLEAGRDELHIEPVRLEELVTEVGGLMEPLARQKGLGFRVEQVGVPELVETDPRKLRQILLNLMGNAVKFTEQGEVRLSVRTEGGQLILSVEDTGIGIPRAYLHRIFEPFWQVDGTRTRRVGGTGLGLGVVRQLAERLGGTVQVRSEEGVGSTFTVLLPLERPAPAGTVQTP